MSSHYLSPFLSPPSDSDEPQAGSDWSRSERASSHDTRDILARKTRSLRVINRLGLLLLQQSTLEQVLWLVAKSAIGELGFDDCVVYLLDEERNVLVQKAAIGAKNPVAHEILDPILIPVGSGIVGSVAVTGKAENVRNCRLDQRYIVDDDIRLSELAVPIIHEGRVIGVIDSEHPDANFYTDDDCELLTTIASMASTKIANAMAIERLNRTVEELRQAHEALRRGEERYRMLYDLHPSMFFTLDPDGRIVSVNHFAADQLGVASDALVGTQMAAFHIGHPTVEQRIRQCLAQPHRLHRWEARKRTADGREIWVRETARVVTAEGEDRPSIFLVSEDITQNHQLAQELDYRATHDGLTGLCNRGEFESRLEAAFEWVRNGGSQYALLYIDLDQFKVLNDTCGHVAGDELLRKLGDLFLQQVRDSDTVARLGGDEFGVLMDSCSLPTALRIAGALRRAVEEFRFRWLDQVFTFGVSIGVVAIDEKSEGVDTVLAAADNACYAAKEAGRNRIHLYSESDEDLLRRRKEMRWVARINQALEESRFRLYAQPIVPVVADSDEPPHYEILLRMEDEVGEIIAPGAFLPAAERYGLSVKVDRWVVTTALAWMQSQIDTPAADTRYAINLSGHSLSDNDFLRFLTEALRDTAVDAGRICIEITETAAISNLTKAGRFIGALKDLGCRFALDDFGSGLSSFAYLKNLPVDFLKIDGAFVKGLAHDDMGQAMVRSIHDVGKMMGKRTIAEFVDGAETLSTLKKIGVDYAQGYYLGKPAPIESWPGES